MPEPQLCLACGTNPAAPSSGTVPLCTSCQALRSNPRGVKFDAPKPKPKKARGKPR